MIYLPTKCCGPDLKVPLVITLKQKTTKSVTYLPYYSMFYKNIAVAKVEIFFQKCSTMQHRTP
jgi:hypothetical protein